MPQAFLDLLRSPCAPRSPTDLGEHYKTRKRPEAGLILGQSPSQECSRLPADEPVFVVPKQLVKILDRDLWRLAGDLRKEMFRLIAEEHGCDPLKAQELFRGGVRPTNPARFHEYETEVWRAAGQCRKMLNALKAAKGVDCFLETEWDCHRLLCIPKNPRK